MWSVQRFTYCIFFFFQFCTERDKGSALGQRPEMPSGIDPLVAKKAYYTFCFSAGILGAQYGVDRPATGFMVILTPAFPG